MPSTAGVLDHRFVVVKIERDDERAGVIWRGEQLSLPAPRGEAQRRVLELWLRRGEHDGKFPEHLGVGVQRVARGAPRVVRNG